MAAKKKRKRNPGAKGGQFERQLAGDLSRWWTRGERDDIFWRTGGSGGRATVRGRRGAATFNGYGDLFATDPIGQPLFELVTIEIKRGYNEHHVYSVLDCSRTPRAQQEWETWIQQAKTAWRDSGAFSWLVINKRDGRDAMVFMPYNLLWLLIENDVFPKAPNFNVLTIRARLLECDYDKVKGKWKEVSRRLLPFERICSMRLEDLLNHLTPEHVRHLASVV